MELREAAEGWSFVMNRHDDLSLGHGVFYDLGISVILCITSHILTREHFSAWKFKHVFCEGD